MEVVILRKDYVFLKIDTVYPLCMTIEAFHVCILPITQCLTRHPPYLDDFDSWFSELHELLYALASAVRS